MTSLPTHCMLPLQQSKKSMPIRLLKLPIKAFPRIIFFHQGYSVHLKYTEKVTSLEFIIPLNTFIKYLLNKEICMQFSSRSTHYIQIFIIINYIITCFLSEITSSLFEQYIMYTD